MLISIEGMAILDVNEAVFVRFLHGEEGCVSHYPVGSEKVGNLGETLVFYCETAGVVKFSLKRIDIIRVLPGVDVKNI